MVKVPIFSRLGKGVGIVFSVVLIIGIAITVFLGVTALVNDRVNVGSNYAVFASGLSTILLVLVTAWYVGLVREQTQEMTKQALVTQESEWVPEILFNAKSE